MTKAYRLSNGIVLETPAEMDAYIRGIETTRDNPETINSLLEEAHVVKAAGAKTEEELAAEAEAAKKKDAPAEEAKPE